MPYNYQSKIGYDSLIQNVILKELINKNGTTITGIDKELKLKFSRRKYFESRLFEFYYIQIEVKSISECLNRVDNMIFEKSLKCLVKGDLEDIGISIEWQQAGVVARGEYIEERFVAFSVLSQINQIIERYYSDDDEEDLDEQYKKLRQKILEWFEVINTKPEINDQQ